MKILKRLTVCAALLAAGSAQAATYDLGTLLPGHSLTRPAVVIKSFEDSFDFKLGSAAKVASIAAQFALPPVVDINDISFNMKLYTGSSHAAGTLLSSISGGKSLAIFSDVLSAGPYHLKVAGQGTGFFGLGAYTTTVAAPVPLPGAIWLFGSALLFGIGLMRSKTKA